MEDRNNIHWRSPLLIVGFWVLGILLYVGHDQFYASLSGTTATDQQYRVLGSRHSEQQFNLAIGTGIAFLARASFSLTASTSYFQMSWLSLRRAKPGQRTATLEVIDTVFSATSNVFAFAYAPVWVRKPLLFQVALTIWLLPLPAVITPATLSVSLQRQAASLMQYMPIVDYISLKTVNWMIYSGWYDDSYVYNGASGDVKRLAFDVVTHGDVLPVTPITDNSTWSVTFPGPYLRCEDIVSSEQLSIAKNIANASRGALTPRAAYLSWFPRYTSWSPDPDPMPYSHVEDGMYFDVPDKFFSPAWDDGAGLGEVGPMPPLFVIVVPGVLGLNHISYENMEQRTARILSNSTMLQCNLLNATYDLDFNWTNRIQSVAVKVREDSLTPMKFSVGLVLGKSLSDCASVYDLRVPGIVHHPECSVDTHWVKNVFYQGAFQAFTSTLTGVAIFDLNTDISQYLESGTETSNIRGTVLFDAEEFAFVSNYTPYRVSTFQRRLWQSNSTELKRLSGLNDKSFDTHRRSLKNAIEDLFRNYTISLMNARTFQYVRPLHYLRFDGYHINAGDRPDLDQNPEWVKSKVTMQFMVNVYVYDRIKLWLAYSCAAAFTLVAAILGLLAIYAHGASYDANFSTVLRASRHAELSAEVQAADEDGRSPLPRHLAKATFTMTPREKFQHVGIISGSAAKDSLLAVPLAGYSNLPKRTPSTR